jgi:hypothetical protein
MTKSEFIEFCDNYKGELFIFGMIAIDLNIGVYYY